MMALEQSVGGMLDYITGKFSQVEMKLDKLLESLSTDPDSKIRGAWSELNEKIDKIAQAVNVRDEVLQNSVDDAEDRKRLKERLKEAIEKDKASQTREIHNYKEAWLEYLFGICQPDKRVGKHGSK